MYRLIGMTCPSTEKQFKDFNVCDNVEGIYAITITVIKNCMKIIRILRRFKYARNKVVPRNFFNSYHKLQSEMFNQV